MSDYKICFLDIENSPNISYTWGKYDQNVIAFQKEWYLLSFAWKWQHERTTEVVGLNDFPRFDRDKSNDKDLAIELWNVLDEADLVVAHNGIEHDVRKANARFLYHGLPPPSPYRVVDTLKVARSKFSFNSNKLADLATLLGVGQKFDTGGFQLWLDCMDGKPEAWVKMKRYNKQDVVILEKIYNALRAWDAYHPNITLDTGKSHRCPVCGSTTERRGWSYLKSWRAARYHCLNQSCGRWSKGEREKLPQQVLA